MGKSKLSNKETKAFGKGLYEVIDGMANNGIKAMDQIIVHKETGKRYFIGINEV